ncbi:MAG TPA: BON domain-containing protein [Gemmatimonadales bacterium]|nr:BON domain-containing protein [Gemmatimonadales bacterium]
MDSRVRLSGWQLVAWAALGVASGLAVGFMLGEWFGDVNAPRVRRAARRMRQPPRPPLSAAGAARAATAALAADPELRSLGLEATAIAAGTVELHGWVPSRAARTRAARLAGTVPGVESVVNSILVRGEDDRTLPSDYLATDQSA